MTRRVEKLSVTAGVILVVLVAMLPSTGGAQQGDDADSTAGTASAAPSLPPAGYGGVWSEGANPMGGEGAADREWSVGCDFATAVKTGTITLGEVDVATPCIVVSAGDLVTWVNPTGTTVAVETGDQFSTEDVSTAFSTLEVAAHGQVTVRLIHAGLIEYSASDHPGVRGTILVLGRGAA
jgi:plastocyanin